MIHDQNREINQSSQEIGGNIQRCEQDIPNQTDRRLNTEHLDTTGKQMTGQGWRKGGVESKPCQDMALFKNIYL